MSASTVVAFGRCARVIDTPSQGTSYLRIEIPVEFHAEMTKAFYGRDVLVMLAGQTFVGQAYGVMESEIQPEPAPAAPAAPPPVPPVGKHFLDAIEICKTPQFQQFVACISNSADKSGSEAASAEFIKKYCGIKSRRDLDGPYSVRPRQQMGALMAEYREWQRAFRDAGTA